MARILALLELAQSAAAVEAERVHGDAEEELIGFIAAGIKATADMGAMCAGVGGGVRPSGWILDVSGGGVPYIYISI